MKAPLGRRFNGFLGLSLNDGTVLFLAILLDKTASVGQDSLCIRTLALTVPLRRRRGHRDSGRFRRGSPSERWRRRTRGSPLESVSQSMRAHMCVSE